MIVGKRRPRVEIEEVEISKPQREYILEEYETVVPPATREVHLDRWTEEYQPREETVQVS